MAKKKKKKTNKKADMSERVKEVHSVSDAIELPVEDNKAKDLELINLILQKVDRADVWFVSNKQEEFEYAQDASISHLKDEAGWATRSHVFDSSTEKACRSLISKYVIAIAEYLVGLSLSGIGVGDIKKAKVLKKLLFTTMQKMPNFFENMLTFIRQVVLYGTGAGKVTYHQLFRNVKHRILNPATNEFEVQTKTIKIYDGPYFFPINVTNNFRIDPDATKIDGFDKFHRAWKTVRELKSLQAQGIYKNIENITVDPADVQPSMAPDTRTPRNYESLNSSPTRQPAMEDDVVEVLEYWRADDSRVITIINREIIAQDQENPFFHGRHPFVSAIFEKIDFQFYGRGAPAKARTEQDMTNSLTNLLFDGLNATVNPMYKAIEGEFEGDFLTFRPNGVVHVPSQDTIQPFDRSTPDLQVTNWIFKLQKDIEEKTGATRETTGIGTTKGATTATEFRGQFMLGNELHTLNIQMLTEIGFVEVLRRMYWTILQSMSSKMQVKITEEETVEVSPEDLPLDLDFELNFGNTQQSKEEIKQNLVFMFQTVGPALVNLGVSKKVLLRIVAKLLESMGQKPEEFGLTEQMIEEENQVGPEGEGAQAGAQSPNANVGTPGASQAQAGTNTTGAPITP